ncbi:MAG: hypothetical protein JWN36_3161 [Microbacteriaceae bacterium]|nr:hypothetical protein [Microbacteriaceae bacterium]
MLVLTGSFQLYRAAVADAVVFFAMAALLLVSLTGILDRFDGRRVQPRRLVLVVGIAIAAGVLVASPRHSVADAIVVSAAGVAALAVAWPNPAVEGGRVADARIRRTAILWAIAGLLFCAWELATYFLGYGMEGRTAYPALSDLLDPVLNTPLGRVVGVAAWIAGGIALLRRGHPQRAEEPAAEDDLPHEGPAL